MLRWGNHDSAGFSAPGPHACSSPRCHTVSGNIKEDQAWGKEVTVGTLKTMEGLASVFEVRLKNRREGGGLGMFHSSWL